MNNTAANVNTNNDHSNSHSLQLLLSRRLSPSYLPPPLKKEGFFVFFFPGIHRESTPIVQIFEVGKMDESDSRVSLRSHGLKFPHFSLTSQENGRRSKRSSPSTYSVALSSQKIPRGLNAGGHPWQIFVFL